LAHGIYLSYRQNKFLNKYPKFDCTKHLPVTKYFTHVEVENGYSENQSIGHRLKEHKPLIGRAFEYPGEG